MILTNQPAHCRWDTEGINAYIYIFNTAVKYFHSWLWICDFTAILIIIVVNSWLIIYNDHTYEGACPWYLKQEQDMDSIQRMEG